MQTVVGLIVILVIVAADENGEGIAMYNDYMSPFSPSYFGIRARDSLPAAMVDATADEMEDAVHPRLNSLRMAIRMAGYTCGVVGTGEIDPFELGPKFAPPLPTVSMNANSKSRMKRKRKMKMLEKNSNNSQSDAGSGAISESRSLMRSLFRFKREAMDSKDIGQVANLNQFCWQVKVRIDFGNGTMKVCGGTIVGSRTVLTAAHCIIDRRKQKSISPSVITVQVGDEENDNNTPHCVEIFPVDLVVPHPEYSIDLEDNDIGLVLLSHPIDLVNKPCACKLCMKDKEPRVGDVCVVAGYGRALEQAGSKITSLRWHKQRILRQTFDSRCAFHVGGGQITNLDSFICAGDLDDDESCQGDDGSQLLCFDEDSDSHYAAGIVSFSAGCGKHIGSQYTKVRTYLNWIEDTAPRSDVLIQRGWNREIARQL